jgi:CheY-like chemotaxis protein
LSIPPKIGRRIASKGQAGVAANGATIKLWNDKKRPAKVAAGVSLKHASVVSVVRILVVEDNASDIFLLQRALNQQDFRFELVHLLNGSEALAFIRRQGIHADAAVPNLILVDLNLAKYTGADILREIRGASHFSGVPVCVWSSSRSRRDEALLKELGVVQFITKPSGLDQFMEIGKIIKDLVVAPRAG